jgi:hypothetical protein
MKNVAVPYFIKINKIKPSHRLIIELVRLVVFRNRKDLFLQV